MAGYVAGSTPATRDGGLTSDLDARRAPRREEATLDTLSPRDIQARIRSGATVAELAEESGMDVAAIDRFSGPPLAERAWVSTQARACVVRPGTDDLETLVRRDVSGQGEALTWDAWRRPDGRWTVVAAIGEDSPVSTWVYDPRSRSIHPDDAASHRMASEDVVVPLRTATSSVPDVRHEPVDADVTDAPAHMDAPAHIEPSPDGASAQGHAREDGEVEPPSEDESASETAKPVAETTRTKGRKGRRASVPRWDEILFGAGQSDS